MGIYVRDGFSILVSLGFLYLATRAFRRIDPKIDLTFDRWCKAESARKLMILCSWVFLICITLVALFLGAFLSKDLSLSSELFGDGTIAAQTEVVVFESTEQGKNLPPGEYHRWSLALVTVSMFFGLIGMAVESIRFPYLVLQRRAQIRRSESEKKFDHP